MNSSSTASISFETSDCKQGESDPHKLTQTLQQQTEELRRITHTAKLFQELYLSELTQRKILQNTIHELKGVISYLLCQLIIMPSAT